MGEPAVNGVGEPSLEGSAGFFGCFRLSELLAVVVLAES